MAAWTTNSMQVHEFFAKYANTPLAKRGQKIDFSGLNVSLNDIYREMQSLEDRMRPMRIRQEALLKEADKYYAAVAS